MNNLTAEQIAQSEYVQQQIIQGFVDIWPILLAVSLICYAITVFVLGRLFKKAGVPQWMAWVPALNTWKIFEIGKQPPWLSLIALIPIPFISLIGLVFLIPSVYNINKQLGKSKAFLLMAAFLPIVWLGWLAFDDSKWQSK